jgi:hypothetical protein
MYDTRYLGDLASVSNIAIASALQRVLTSGMMASVWLLAIEDEYQSKTVSDEMQDSVSRAKLLSR